MTQVEDRLAKAEHKGRRAWIEICQTVCCMTLKINQKLKVGAAGGGGQGGRLEGYVTVQASN